MSQKGLLKKLRSNKKRSATVVSVFVLGLVLVALFSLPVMAGLWTYGPSWIIGPYWIEGVAPLPTTSPTPTPSPTPVPTTTPTASPAPTATPSPVPTATPPPGATPYPNYTLAPVTWSHVATRFQFPTGAYLYITENATFLNSTIISDCWYFTDFTYKTKHTDSFLLTSYVSNITLEYLDYNNYLEYTLDSAGTQAFFTEKEPTLVTINDVATDTLYSYSGGWLNITGAPASSTVKVYFAGSGPGTLPSSPANYYFLSYTHLVNRYTGYQISPQSGWTYASMSQTFNGTGQVDFGFQAWLIHSDNNTADEPLVGEFPTAIITRTSDGEGMQNNTVYCTEKNLVVNLNSIKVTVYIRFNGGEWLKLADYTTDRLMQRKLNAGFWTFNLYTKVDSTSGDTVATAYWGDQTRLSGIGGVVFTAPTPQEIALATGMGGDFISMILYPYVYVIGDIFYGLILAFVAGTLYFRHKNLWIVLVLFILWGSTTGFGLLIPVAAFKIVYIIILLAIASLLYRVFK